LLIPDDRQKGTRVDNVRPSVRITGGAATPEPAGIDYKVNFYWSGSDVDGAVALYQWAVDDTVTERAWEDTTGFSAQFKFGATERMGLPTQYFSDWHTFYIRAIDNEGAISVPDRRYFNARTIAPRTTITLPDLEVIGELQRTFKLVWEGEDIDSSRPDKKPIWYEYKLVRLGDGEYPAENPQLYISALRDRPNELSDLPGEAKKRWVRVPEEVRTLTLRDLPQNAFFVFGVRAVDEAGALEPDLELNRNYFAFAVSPVVSTPKVTVTEERLGRHVFPDDGDTWPDGGLALQVPSGVDLVFRWTGDARDYGSEAGNSNYALDVADPDNESIRNDRGIGGWIGWGRWKGNQFPIRFTEDQAGTTHHLYIKMRDISDTRTSETRCTIRLVVVGFTFDKLALVVDDARFQNVRDVVHDEFVDRYILPRLRDFGEVDIRPLFSGPTESGNPAVISLGEMATYQHILWSCETISADNGLWGAWGNEVGLVSYLTAGGRLFLFGGRVTAMNRGQYGYPVEPPGPNDDNRERLYYNFMYMHHNIVSGRCTVGNCDEACYARISGIAAARTLDPAFPDIVLDRSKWDPWMVQDAEYTGGPSTWEGSLRDFTQAPEHWEGLDSLYAVETWDRSLSDACQYGSVSKGAICGMRYAPTYADTLASRQHGRIIFFLFQPFWHLPDQVLSASTAAINWLVTGKD